MNISVTHMSNIETGNTKLSLPVLYEIAGVLSVGTDDILNWHGQRRERIQEDIAEILDTCSERDLSIIKDALREIKVLLDKHRGD